MTTVEVFAPAKINLTLHVTGRRSDGYHLLDSLVAFANTGDCVHISLAEKTTLTVTGPMAEDVPTGPSNLCVRAADLFGQPAHIQLEKHLPAAAGIGGGSSDAAAVLRGLEQLTGRPFSGDAASVGADVPVCYRAEATRMAGIGDVLTPFALPPLYAVLVNPGVEVSTADIFRRLNGNARDPMSDPPAGADAATLCDWLRSQRNDMEDAALAVEPSISVVMEALCGAEGQLCCRMSGSGATCFALFEAEKAAAHAAAVIADENPDWWVRVTALN